MNCDRIAPFYGLIERLVYGKRLQVCRLRRLALAQGKRRALVLGDGNGAFTAELAKAYPGLAVDSVELSEGMIAQAKRRGVTLRQGDAFTFPLKDGAYDLVFTHFFLDCFDVEKLSVLAARVRQAMKRDAQWVVSEFRLAPSGWRYWYGRVLLRVMYVFFRMSTGLEANALPDHAAVFGASGLAETSEWVSWDGLLVSQVWRIAP